MATYVIEKDLYKTLSDLDSFDRKNPMLEEDFVAVSGIVWSLDDSGSVQVLYRDGKDLGTPQTTVSGVVTDGQWFFDSSEDKLTLSTTDAPTDHRLEFSVETWEDQKTESMQRASEELESLLDVRHPRPLPKSQASNSSRDYDFIIIKITSILACIDLISSSKPASPKIAIFNNMLYNEEGTGYVDRINAGEIKFSWEGTDSDSGGTIEDVSLDPSTTGSLVDPVGTASVEYGVMLVKIGTGGTIITGTENETVTYSVTDQAGSTLVSNTVVTGLYQTMGMGISARFTAGIYVADDVWKITVNSKPGTAQIKSIKLIAR